MDLGTYDDDAMEEVPDPAPRIIRPTTNMATFWATVMKTTPIIFRKIEIKTPVRRPTRSTTGPMNVATIAQPRNEAAALRDFVAVVSLRVSLYEGRMLMPFLCCQLVKKIIKTSGEQVERHT